MHAVQKCLTPNRLTIYGDSSNASQIINPHIIRKVHDHRMAAADTISSISSEVLPTELFMSCLIATRWPSSTSSASQT